jgi:molecular chaperone IbpA
MVKANLYTPKTIRDLLNGTVGFEPFFSSTLDTPSYPPHNLIETGENQYLIEIAAAGFSEDQLFITVKENMLTILGEPAEKKHSDSAYIRRGLAARKFNLTFALAPQVNVVESTYDNGILSISLERIIPEEQKPRQIPINRIERKLLVE